MRYGKYCGILYSGCPGEKPCDALDACCMIHDNCVADHNSKIDILSTLRLFLTLVYLKHYPKRNIRQAKFPRFLLICCFV
jgi:hypothetical protein